MFYRMALYVIVIVSGLILISLAIGARVKDPGIDMGIVVFSVGLSIIGITAYVLKILNIKENSLEKAGSISYVIYECCRYAGFILGVYMFIHLFFMKETPLFVKGAAILGVPLIFYYSIKRTLQIMANCKKQDK